MAIVVLDRDGVINHDSDNYIKTVEEWQPIPGAIEAMATLFKAGHRLFVSTNQSGIGRGYYTAETLHAMHEKMLDLLHQAGGKVEGIYYCPHHPDEGCQCRKPLPGMLDTLMKEHQLTLERSFFVGDSLRDLEAGLARGCQPILVKTGKGKRTLEKGLPPHLSHTLIFDDLAQFAHHLSQ